MNSFTAFSSVARGKKCALFNFFSFSVLFTYFQTVLAGWEVFQSKTKQVLMIFLKKSQVVVILLMKMQHSKSQFSQKKSVLSLISFLLDSVLFTYFQTVGASWEVF